MKIGKTTIERGNPFIHGRAPKIIISSPNGLIKFLVLSAPFWVACFISVLCYHDHAPLLVYTLPFLVVVLGVVKICHYLSSGDER